VLIADLLCLPGFADNRSTLESTTPTSWFE